MLKKIILGTAGLGGLPYGREKRVVSRTDATLIMTRAYNAGIKTFDTAPAYGNAEAWLGEALGNRIATVYTKTDGDKLKARASLSHFYSKISPTYLWHAYENQITPAWISGVSIYAADLPHKLIDSRFAVQMDWNVLNQTKFPKCKSKIARSVFLQGVLAGEKIPKGLGNAVAAAKQHAKLHMMELPEFALRAALQNRDIDHVIVGPTTIEELETCLKIAAQTEKPLGDFASLHVGGAMTDPRTWA